MILVSHAYLGGTRLEWWQEYEKALTLETIDWNGFDNWVSKQKIIKMKNSDIPVNEEVNYVQPKPEKPMEEYEPISTQELLEKPENSSSDEMMCL